ncbi:MAG: hypothetical protein HPY79_05760 [Bacteroidales bacterium]|nr:hypothetical protein [Bacteroidales bacterium]
MKTKLLLSAAVVLGLMSCSSTKHVSAIYSDDIYSSPSVSSHETVATPEKTTNSSDAYYQNNESNMSTSDANVEKNTSSDSQEKYVTNNYYSFDKDDYYDYEYSARLRRFHDPYIGCGYYDSYYTNTYWYTYDPWDWGISIYFGFHWWPFYQYYYYPSYYAVGFYYPWYHPFWGYHPYYYYAGYYGYGWYGYHHGYHHGYWNGYHDGYWNGYWDGYYDAYAHNFYYNSHDGTFYGHRGDGSSSGSRGRDPYNSFVSNYHQQTHNEVLSRPTFANSTRPANIQQNPNGIQDNSRKPVTTNQGIEPAQRQPSTGFEQKPLNGRTPTINEQSGSDGNKRPVKPSVGAEPSNNRPLNNKPQISEPSNSRPNQPSLNNLDDRPINNRPQLAEPSNARPTYSRPETNDGISRPSQSSFPPSNERPNRTINEMPNNSRPTYSQPQRENNSIEYRRPENNSYNREVVPQPSRNNAPSHSQPSHSPSYSQPSRTHTPSFSQPSHNSGNSRSSSSSSTSGGGRRR